MSKRSSSDILLAFIGITGILAIVFAITGLHYGEQCATNPLTYPGMLLISPMARI